MQNNVLNISMVFITCEQSFTIQMFTELNNTFQTWNWWDTWQLFCLFTYLHVYKGNHYLRSVLVRKTCWTYWSTASIRRSSLCYSANTKINWKVYYSDQTRPKIKLLCARCCWNFDKFCIMFGVFEKITYLWRWNNLFHGLSVHQHLIVLLPETNKMMSNWWNHLSLKISIGASLVTLVVAFGFLLQNFGRWRGPMNGTLCHSMDGGSVVGTPWGGGIVKPYLQNIFFKLFALTRGRDAEKLWKRVLVPGVRAIIVKRSHLTSRHEHLLPSKVLRTLRE